MTRRKRKSRIRKVTESEIPEFLRLVKDDIAFLRSLNFREPSRTDVRLASGVLRRLLYEELLKAAWAICGFEEDLRINATDLDAMIGELPRRYIHYAYAGGAKTKGAQHCGYMLLVVPKEEVSPEGPKRTAEELHKHFSAGKRRDFSLSDFNASACVVSGEAGVSRLGIVRYVSNKLGGVHWDNERGGWSEPVGSRHRLLDEAHIVVGRLPAALYEVLSIAQAVAESVDVKTLCEKIDSIAPEEALEANVIRFREGRIGKYENITFQEKNENKDG